MPKGTGTFKPFLRTSVQALLRRHLLTILDATAHRDTYLFFKHCYCGGFKRQVLCMLTRISTAHIYRG